MLLEPIAIDPEKMSFSKQQRHIWMMLDVLFGWFSDGKLMKKELLAWLAKIGFGQGLDADIQHPFCFFFEPLLKLSNIVKIKDVQATHRIWGGSKI